MKFCNKFGLINDSPEVRKEYKRRHDEIWPEMVEMIKRAGLYNYNIWNVGDMLIEVYECDDLQKLQEVVGSSDVKKRWDAYMSDILVYNEDGSATPLDLMFNID
ncbi:MAG: L-rhamnose mutarotase [Oscillospiraceae bacterium]|nr:L-rhamnose mutarotase [Oscillospiraceae bacterium]MBQ9939559.1 L-rhamnose mutarotase [Oscillospiraceae bacterium]